jgi:deoxyribonuclease-4
MLIGAHVSPAGGLSKAIDRGTERGCRAIQIFNQSPRRWKPTAYSEEDLAAFREARAGSPIEGVLVHAVYLLNCASDDRELRSKSLTSLVHSLQVGQGINANAVVLHPGSAKVGAVPSAIKRAGKTIREALRESEGCPLHLENTAGAGGTLGRSIDQLAALLEASGADERLGLCLDSCHLFASGYDIRTPAGIDAVASEVATKIGLERLGSLHLNDSQAGLGSNRDRHANVGKGQLGRGGCAVFLAAPAFEALPCVLETPGEDHEGPSRREVALARTLRKRGVAARR